MSKADKIMNRNISHGEKLAEMKLHYETVDNWLENNPNQGKYSQDELYEMIKEILDYIVELTKEVRK